MQYLWYEHSNDKAIEKTFKVFKIKYNFIQ